jgi:hypothetical protein
MVRVRRLRVAGVRAAGATVAVLTGALGCSLVNGFAELPGAQAGGTSGVGAAGGSAEDGTAAPAASGAGAGCAACRAGELCAPSVPEGWSGPVVLAEATDLPAACGADWPDEVALMHGGSVVPEAQCATCGCKTVGETCVASECSASVYSLSSCAGAETVVPGSVSCQIVDLTGAKSFKADPWAASGGSCAAVGGGAMLPPPSFSSFARLCSTGVVPAGGCVPAAPAGFGAVCVHAPGQLACPEGFEREELHEAFGPDTRGCSPCACGTAPVQPGSCEATFKVYESPACSGSAGSYKTDGLCKGVFLQLGTVGARTEAVALAEPGQCAPPAGGTPIGDVELVGTRTVCCTPLP